MKCIMADIGISTETIELTVEVIHKKISEGLFEFTTQDIEILCKVKQETFESLHDHF